jgi:CRP-like cAMP-binding protein
MAPDPVETLAAVPLFSSLSSRDLKRLAKRFRSLEFADGESVTIEGKGGVGFFVVLEGGASVTVGSDVVRALGPGDHFGEMALIDEGPRSASVVALGPLRCLGMTPWEFKPFVEDNPKVAWELMRILARRVRDAEARVSA